MFQLLVIIVSSVGAQLFPMPVALEVCASAGPAEAAEQISEDGTPPPQEKTAEEIAGGGAPSPQAEAASRDSASLAAALRRAAELNQGQGLDLPAHDLVVVGNTEAGEDALKVLQQMSRSPDAALRLQAVEGWAAANPQEASTALLKLLLDKSEKVRHAAAQALVRTKNEAMAPAILDLLHRQDFKFMQYSTELLPVLAPLLAPVCMHAFSDETLDVAQRAANAYALGVMRHLSAQKALTEGAESQDLALARTCAQALYTLNSGESASVWLKLAEHPDGEIAGLAIGALATNGGVEAKSRLFEIAGGKRSEEHLQLQALEAVQSWPERESIPSLIQVMANNPRLAPVCSKFLTQKTKEDFGGSPQLWGEWWVKMTTPPRFDPPPTGAPGPQGAANASAKR